MSNENNNKKAKMILRIETENKTVERVIEGNDNIAYILDEAGIFDDEIMALLGFH